MPRTVHHVGLRLATIDAAEAWRRARSHFKESGEEEPLISIQPFPEGFLARHVHTALPAPPALPEPSTERVLVVDRITGQLTVWPLMPLTTTSTQYRRFKRGEPMTFE
ncbi:hypothetical protein ABZ801_38130 [Actinomadura sp. NPDC047616]|uniref:hypothetical protein n=1 Tax=Actinomadura sp. NPDC047616 TaxID=3155914 RepID=UPI0033D6305D